jgi:hypothetical protein
MRSPWQVLKGFASRSKADGTSEHPDEAEDVLGLVPEEPQADESTHPQHLSDLTHSDTDTVSIRVSIAAEEPTALAQEQRATDESSKPPLRTEVSFAHEDAQMPELVEAKAPPTTSAPPPAKVDGPLGNQAHGKQTARAERKSSRATSLDHDARQSNEIGVVDQAMALETEINALREQLSEKLLAQNTHLRMLLERYDP